MRKRLPSEPGFSTAALLAFGTGSSFVVGNCLVHCGVFSSIAGLYPLDLSRKTPHPVVILKCGPGLPSVHWRTQSPPNWHNCFKAVVLRMTISNTWTSVRTTTSLAPPRPAQCSVFMKATRGFGAHESLKTTAPVQMKSHWNFMRNSYLCKKKDFE